MSRFHLVIAGVCLASLVGCSGSGDGGAGTDSAGSSGTDGSSAGTDSASTGDLSATGATGPAGCGDGVVGGDEVCDDGNTLTEAAPQAVGACAADCSMDLSLCGNGDMDPGEQCDDGNADSTDGCTTSCTTSDMGIHAPCTCEGADCSNTDFSAGTIVGCDNVVVPSGAELACFRSANIFNVTKTYFAEGECGVMSLICEGSNVCPDPIGDYAAHSDCPEGSQFIDKYVEAALGAMVNSKVCQLKCESDMDCRWNAADEFWMEPTQIRCQTTADSNGVNICVDARNNE